MELVCIKCPRGCRLQVEKDSVTGNLCPRGLDYAKEEMTCPMRIVTALIRVDGKIIPVKTSKEVPKEKIDDVLDLISKISVNDTFIGKVVAENILGLGVDIIVTGEPYMV
jgi:CxxC motif-containing protein